MWMTIPDDEITVGDAVTIHTATLYRVEGEDSGVIGGDGEGGTVIPGLTQGVVISLGGRVGGGDRKVQVVSTCGTSGWCWTSRLSKVTP